MAEDTDVQVSQFRRDVEAFLAYLSEGVQVICRMDQPPQTAKTDDLIQDNQCGTVKYDVINDVNRMRSFWQSVSNSIEELKDDLPVLQLQLTNNRATFDAYVQEYGLRRDVKDTLSAQRRAQQLMETTLTSSRAIYRDKNKKMIPRNQREWRDIRKDMSQLLDQARGARGAAQYGEELRSANKSHRACQRSIRKEDDLEAQQKRELRGRSPHQDSACREKTTSTQCVQTPT